MLGPFLIALGAALMIAGALLLSAWLSGKASWFDADVYDRPGATKTDRQFISLYFVALVLAPLLVGAVFIVYGLTLIMM
jgi:hypothetical protein